ncbi:MAG: hypothetical protein CMI53_05125, partial [Parcubacteria group bacterium]|nr:hypothetical protein [Parcubacteria group bacterium]
MPRNKLEEIIESFGIKEFSQFFRLKTRADGNFRPSEERLSQYEDADFFDFIKLGQIEFSETQRLIVAGTKVNKDLSERSGKKAQYEKAKKMLRELSVYSAGIFIFYDKDGNFRFSLIYPESVGTRREWSNFRRFTYFVSKELTNKTFLQRIGDGDFSTLEKINDAFSVEKVTKEFYLEYRKLFDGLMENLSKNHAFLGEASKNGINTENFAKKLLGQIVFLYFIQKKGWLGVRAGGNWGDGDKTFMGNLYKDAISKGANFYNDYLEKLFYNALNNSHRDSADPSFSRDFNSRIPFLNGGLFEAEYDWKNSLMYLDNKVFQAMFDVFERYNFTVEEESPDDKEIAVDPEMLGKVFENLLPENLRKGKGTYYTPREIVYYMCRESLVNYLISNHSNITEENIRNYIFYSESFENFKKQKGESFTPGQWKELDNLLINIKVCDPACGSGAFLVGMLNMIVKLRIFLQTTPDSNQIPQKKEYELKRETIQNCIYGVDIDPGAIEIAKLRLWLALVVDYDLEDIEPLPNLDYRLMCGNSLLEEFEGVKFYNGENELQATLLPVEPEKRKKIESLKKKVKEYFSVHDDKDKLKKRKEINDVKDWLVRSALEKRRQEITTQHKGEEAKANMLDEKSRKKYLAGFSKWLDSSSNIQQALESLHNPKKEKPFFIWKLEFVDVFEDKKGFDVVIANPPYVFTRGASFSKSFKKVVEKNYFCGKGKINLFSLFIERASMILRKGGIYIYIIPNTFFRVTSYKPAREFIVKMNRVIQIVDLHAGIFEGVTASTAVLEVQNIATSNPRVSIIEDFKQNGYLEKRRFIDQKKFNNHEFVFSIYINDASSRLFTKIKGNSFELKNICKDIIEGIVTPKGKKSFISTEKKNEFYKSFLEGKDIDPYKIEWKHKYINFDKKRLHRPRPDYLWESPVKILIRRIGGGNKAIICALDTNKFYTYASINNLLLKDNCGYDYKFILALLNSKLLNWYYIENFTNRSGLTVNISRTFLDVLPIKMTPKIDQESFTKIVNEILAVTKSSDYLKNSPKQAKVKEYEKQIDRLVYNLYNLSPDEIEIVENFERRG